MASSLGRSPLREAGTDILADDERGWRGDEEEFADSLVEFDVRSGAAFVATDLFEALRRNPSQNYVARKVVRWQ